MDKSIVSRETLYAEVWAEPMVAVAKRYGVSSSFLGRVCERLRIPRPGRGYWAELAVGKADPQPPMPALRPGDDIEWNRRGHARRLPEELPRPPDPSSRVKRPREPGTTPHPVLAGARASFDEAKEVETGYLKPSKRNLVDLWTSRALLGKALEAAQAIFATFEANGYTVTFSGPRQYTHRPELDYRDAPSTRYFRHQWRPDRSTLVYVGTVIFGLTLYEPSENVEVRRNGDRWVRVAPKPAKPRHQISPAYDWTPKEDMPSGRLALRIWSPYPRAAWDRTWKETTPGSLAGMAVAIIKILEHESINIAKRVEEGARAAEIERQEWEAKHREWERKEAIRQREAALEEAGKELLEIMDDWNEAKRISAFLDDIDQRAASLSESERAEVQQRIELARAMLGTIDALERLREWSHPDAN